MDWQHNGANRSPMNRSLNGWIAVGVAGYIQQSRIVGVSSVNTAPMRRLLQATPAASIIVLTGGQRRQTVALLDSGHIVITAMKLADWHAALMLE